MIDRLPLTTRKRLPPIHPGALIRFIGTRKSRARRFRLIRPVEAEQALLNAPIAIYEQQVEQEIRFGYYGQTDAGRLLAVIVTERARSYESSLPTISMRAKNRTI